MLEQATLIKIIIKPILDKTEKIRRNLFKARPIEKILKGALTIKEKLNLRQEYTYIICVNGMIKNKQHKADTLQFLLKSL